MKKKLFFNLGKSSSQENSFFSFIYWPIISIIILDSSLKYVYIFFIIDLNPNKGLLGDFLTRFTPINFFKFSSSLGEKKLLPINDVKDLYIFFNSLF